MEEEEASRKGRKGRRKAKRLWKKGVRQVGRMKDEG